MTTSLPNLGVNRSEFEFFWPVRVYHEDIDTQGFVYYANYLKFMERARTEWIRALGFEQTALLEENRVVLVVAEVGVKYHRPARFNDELTVGVRMTRLRALSMELSQPTWRGAQHELICHAEVTVACLDATTHRPTGIPSTLLTELKAKREH